MLLMMKTFYILGLVVGMVTGVVMAEGDDWKMSLEKKVYEKEGKKLSYRLAKPRTGKSVPLVLFLHGAGERGEDNEAQLVHGVKDLMAWCGENKQECVVVAPQCPRNLWWSNYGGNWKVPEETEMKPEPAWPMALVFDVVDDLVKMGGIDPDRIYVTGLSMGGYGSFDAICRRPDFFAAAMPVCGGETRTRPPKSRTCRCGYSTEETTRSSRRRCRAPWWRRSRRRAESQNTVNTPAWATIRGPPRMRTGRSGRGCSRRSGSSVPLPDVDCCY